MQTRRAVWRLAGDIRGEGAAILLRLWSALGWQLDDSTDSTTASRFGVRLSTASSQWCADAASLELPNSSQPPCWSCRQPLS